MKSSHAPTPGNPLPGDPLPGVRLFETSGVDLETLLRAKAGRTIAVCIPARDEEATVGSVVEAVCLPHFRPAGGSGLVDDVLVIDDGSLDATAAAATKAGARVLSTGDSASGGKGQAMKAGLDATDSDIVVFLDADVEDTTAAFVAGLVGPLLLDDTVALVKGFYDRPIDGAHVGGGRVTELVARPLIELLFKELSDIRQPLAGETAARRHVLEAVGFADGYGVEFGLLVDVARKFGVPSIAQVDLGVRTHRNRPLDELRPQATEVIREALLRTSLRS